MRTVTTPAGSSTTMSAASVSSVAPDERAATSTACRPASREFVEGPEGSEIAEIVPRVQHRPGPGGLDQPAHGDSLVDAGRPELQHQVARLEPQVDRLGQLRQRSTQGLAGAASDQAVGGCEPPASCPCPPRTRPGSPASCSSPGNRCRATCNPRRHRVARHNAGRGLPPLKPVMTQYYESPEPRVAGHAGQLGGYQGQVGRSRSPPDPPTGSAGPARPVHRRPPGTSPGSSTSGDSVPSKSEAITAPAGSSTIASQPSRPAAVASTGVLILV